MRQYSPSVLAVACVYVVMKFFGINNYKILFSDEFTREKDPEKVIKNAAQKILNSPKLYLIENLRLLKINIL